MRENVKLDEEFEKLLDEIPLVTSHHNLLHHRHRNVYGGGGADDRGRGSLVTDDDAIHGMCGTGMYNDKYPCASSPVSDFSLLSDGSSSNLFSSGYSFSDIGSPDSSLLDELKSNMSSSGNSNYPNCFWSDSKLPDLTLRKKDNVSTVDELGLCANLSKMYIHDQQENSRDFVDGSIGNNPIRVHKHGDHNDFKREVSNYVGVQSPFPRSPVSPMSRNFETNSAWTGFPQDYKMANLFGSRQCLRTPDSLISQYNDLRASMDSYRHRRQLINNNYCYRGSVAADHTASLSGHPMADTLLCSQQNGVNLMRERSISRLANSSYDTNLRPYLSSQNQLHHNLPLCNARTMLLSNAKIPQAGLDSITSEGSFILQGEGLNYVIGRGFDNARSQNKGTSRGNGFAKYPRRSEPDMGPRVLGAYEIPRSPKIDSSFPSQPNYSSLIEAQGCIYEIAKDQQGCRFLQRMFDEGTPEDVQVIFNEIIDHIVELMVNPFGNYLMQKLLEVCTEEQRMKILLVVTEEPGQLVRISLNTHGTRVVQKLIETLKTRNQISLVVSALEPGFLALIKDLNGNHVIHRCLQFLSNDDNTFIFVAATNYCIDIATHQHGCCVMQRCISHSSGEHREKLIAEITSNALLLAHNQYGNYVVQFVLELNIPYATASIISQFEGNFVHLSMEKFSSHVVEKCLATFNDENRARVICELLSAPHFEQLLQDPHANYVVQSALHYSEGHLYNLLVEAIESHKAISRNCPYSKKIFSQRLLRK